MPLSVKAATPNVRHRKPKKQFIEPVKPYTTGLPPKSSSPSFVPVSSYPTTVSYDSNTAAEQLKATEDLVTLYLTPEDDFTQSPPWSRYVCPHKPKKRSRKRSIEPVKPYTTGLPPKRRSPSFVPDTPYPDTVSGVPNTTAELTASKDLESLHRSSSSTPTPYQPPSVSIEREQKDSPLQKAPEESLHWSSSSTPTPYQPPSVTIEREQKTSDETIHAIEVGEVSEDTGLTATAPTSRQTNREATGEGSEDTELTAPVPTSRQTNRGATGEESEDTGLTATQLTPHQPCQAALQEAPEYNVGEYLFNCIYSTEEGTDYVSCIPHTSVITVADKKCNSANTAITTPVNVLEVNVPFLDKQAVPNYITNNRFEQGGALGGPEQLTLLQSAEFFEYCVNTSPQQPAVADPYKQIQSELAELRKQNNGLMNKLDVLQTANTQLTGLVTDFGTALAIQARANTHLVDMVTGFGTAIASHVSSLNSMLDPMIVCLKNTMNMTPQ
ncbi:proteoglycan 4-like isoform X1 [Perca flavescens]|uniref:proteoglycan 4-like isoform X1 n=1 Tax=Perca flavescens TaxID=8167 RepID=UPI00106DEC3E|nr:proteoglycan 4-like isoform X1 [Perca flavescens]